MLKLYDYEFEAHPILPSVCTVNCGCATVLGILELEPEPDCYDLAGTGPEMQELNRIAFLKSGRIRLDLFSKK